jgi:hypothetical protein
MRGAVLAAASGRVKREPNFASDIRLLAPWHEPCDGAGMSIPAAGSIDMLKRLVAFDTTSRNSNLELIRYIQDYLDGHGVTSTLVPNAEGTKANLFASIGPETEGGIVLSGHTDVVPVDGQPWVTDRGTSPRSPTAISTAAAPAT